MAAKYDSIGVNYAELRKPDQRIAAAIEKTLADAVTVINVGAGTGSYEPLGKQVTAVEPSIEMIRKRPASSAMAIQALAESLPFDDQAFDAAMAVLTVHHWPDQAAGFREIRRVTKGRIVVLTFDPGHRPWLTDYFPELIALDKTQMPAMTKYEEWLGSVQVTPLLVPHDCTDGFLYAYWRRPEAYLDPRIRSGSSSFWAIGNISQGLDRLDNDIATGAWAQRYSQLLTKTEYDVGYRLVVAG